MGLIDRIFGNKISQFFTQMKASVLGAMPVYPDNNTINYIDKGFSGNASIYSVVDTISRKFASMPVYLYQVQEEKAMKQLKAAGNGLINTGAIFRTKQLRTKAYKEDEVVNDLSKLLSNPNPMEGSDAFLKKLYSYYKITGEAFIWLNRGDTGDMTDEQVVKMPVLEMYVLPTQFVQLIIDSEDFFNILGYYFIVDGKQNFIRKVDVIHWKSTTLDFDKYLGTHLRGQSPLKAAFKILTQDDAAADAAVAMYQNGGSKGILFEKSMAKLSTEQVAKIDRVIEQRINNNELKGAVARMQGDWGYLNLGLSSTDMDLLKAQDLNMKKICWAFGVPYELFESNTTFNNKEQAWKFFICNTILPEWYQLRDELNRVLLPAFKYQTTYTIDIDYSDLPELQDNIKEVVASLKDAWWFTGNQRRERMNEETDDTEPLMDVYLIPNNLIPITDLGMNSVDKILNNDTSASGTGSNAPLPGN